MKRLLCVALVLVLLCGCTAAPVETTIPAEKPVLKAGFYIYDGDMGRETLVHFCFQEDGTGYLSMLGNKADLTWTPDGTIQGLLSESVQVTAADGGIIWDGELFRSTGDSLPQGYLPDPPAPGVYGMSSVGRDGDVDFYGVLSRENGYLEIREDGTGVLVFDDTEHPFTLDGAVARFDGWSVMLLDMSDRDPEGAPMVMVYIMDGSIHADSIAFRKLEE